MILVLLYIIGLILLVGLATSVLLQHALFECHVLWSFFLSKLNFKKFNTNSDIFLLINIQEDSIECCRFYQNVIPPKNSQIVLIQRCGNLAILHC